jgi:hypothetical protein
VGSADVPLMILLTLAAPTNGKGRDDGGNKQNGWELRGASVG